MTPEPCHQESNNSQMGGKHPPVPSSCHHKAFSVAAAGGTKADHAAGGDAKSESESETRAGIQQHQQKQSDYRQSDFRGARIRF